MIYTTIVLSIISIVYYFYAPGKVDKTYMSVGLIFLFISIAIFIKSYKYKQVKSNWAEPAILFFFAFLIVHFQNYIIFLTGLDIPIFRFFMRHENIICRSFALSLIGATNFVLGYVIANRYCKNMVTKKPFVVKKEFYSGATFILSFLSYCSYLIFLITVGSFYLSGKYAGTGNWGKGSTYTFVVFSTTLNALIIVRLLYVIQMKGKVTNIVSYVKDMGITPTTILLIHVLFSLYVGDRGPVISLTILYFGFYILKCMRVSMLRFIIFISVSAFIMTLVGMGRTRTGDEEYWTRMSEAYDNSMETISGNESYLSLTSELADSVRCVHYALIYVPSPKYSFGYGKYQMMHLLSVIPGGQSIYKSIRGDSKEFLTTSSLITYWHAGPNPQSGRGTTVVADFYMDLGVLGVIIGMCLTGYFYSNVSSYLRGRNVFSLFGLCLAMIYYSQSVFLSRAGVLFLLQNVFNAYILIKVIHLFLKTKE